MIVASTQARKLREKKEVMVAKIDTRVYDSMISVSYFLGQSVLYL
jgi:hypothetical protein